MFNVELAFVLTNVSFTFALGRFDFQIWKSNQMIFVGNAFRLIHIDWITGIKMIYLFPK